MLGPKKFWAQKNFGSKNNLGPKKSGSNKILVQKMLCLKYFGQTKILVRKIFYPQKILNKICAA